jgi:hypothetical protein
MIKVTIDRNRTPDKYQDGVKFAIDDDRLNVYNKAHECIATYAKGFWASASVENEPEPFKVEPAAPEIPGMVFVGHNT